MGVLHIPPLNTIDDSKSIASTWIRKKYPTCKPRIGIVLGSGLGELADKIAPRIAIPYESIPGFPTPRVTGHAGHLVIGQLGGLQVAALRGRCHLYEGWSIQESLVPVETLLELGVELLILSNASGGINPRFQSGQIVAIDSHIDWLFRTRKAPNLGRACASILGRTHRTYDSVWLSRAQESAEELGFCLPTGTYLATLGPNYETRAEYRAFARMGADLVGMSTVPEALLAMQAGVPVLALSVVTNVANPDLAIMTEHSDVLEWSSKARERLEPLVHKIASKYF